MRKFQTLHYCLITVLVCFLSLPLHADVPTPPAAPAPPSGYCSTIYNELWGDLQAFNVLLSVPPIWKPITGNGPTLFAGNLQVADANTGSAISGSNYLPGVLTQLQELRATGVKAIMVQVGFPVLYAPFLGGQSALQPYLNFYSQVAQAVHNAGLKLIVENDELLSNDIEAGWPGLTNYYSTLSWSEYMSARATMAATVAQTMQPDYLVLSEEPDAEANQTGQANMNNPADAAQMISGMISSVKALKLPNIKLGAGFGNWLNATGSSSLTGYLTSYLTLPLDYIDFHLYPINNEPQASLIENALVIASGAAAAGKPVAISEGWPWKMENSEFGVMTGQDYRARDPFSFWAPLNEYWLQTVQSLAKYTNMLYVAPEGPDYLFTYQMYGGTDANGGAADCKCTTTDCSNYNVVHAETSLSATANDNAVFSTTGLNFSTLMVGDDKTAPSTPTGLTGTPAYNQVTLSWKPATDNVGIAGYNLYRCQPSYQGGSCSGVWIANVTSTGYVDNGLAQGTPYNYEVQAFDLENNKSSESANFSTQTYTSASNAPSNVTPTPVSAAEVDLTWSAPQAKSGLSEYLVYSGTSPSSLRQVGTTAAGVTSFKDTTLKGNTGYYFAVAAIENGKTSPKSPQAWATTFPAPNAPSNLTASPVGSTSIALTWEEHIVHNGLAVNSYQILRGTSSGSLNKIATVNSTSYTDTSLTPGTTYYYQIKAIDSAADVSSASAEAWSKP